MNRTLYIIAREDYTAYYYGKLIAITLNNREYSLLTEPTVILSDAGGPEQNELVNQLMWEKS